MGKLADYLVEHNEITEMKILEKGKISYLKVEKYDNKNIKIKNKIVSKSDEFLDVKLYKDYIISLDDIQFGTKDKDIINKKMYELYKKIKNIEFTDLRVYVKLKVYQYFS